MSARIFAGIPILSLVPLGAAAKGQHIECAMDFSVSVSLLADQKPSISHRALGFYLDDSAKQIVAESGGVSVETTSYSDSRVEADLSDPFPKNGVSLFGNLIDGKIQILIFRATGSAAVFGSLLPNGAVVGRGDCKQLEPPLTTL
jgi:hypothetical protein